MPKIDTRTKARRTRRIEDAALELFKVKGFHGVGLREIAQRAGVSLGNIYNYFDSKEAIFEAVIGRLYGEFVRVGGPLIEGIAMSRFPQDLEELGRSIDKMVQSQTDYLTLVYLDIAEFDGKHVRAHYLGLADRFDKAFKDRFDQLRAQKTFGENVDPAVAFTVIYMQFFNYFIVERLIGARGHMGLDDDQAIRAIASLFRHEIRAGSTA